MSAQMDEEIVYDASTDDAMDLERLKQLKEAKAELEKEIADLQSSLVSELSGPTRVFFNGVEYRATVVSSETVDVDLPRLSNIDPRLYAAITKPVLDTNAFKRVVSSGELSPEVAQEVVSIKPRTAYIKISKFKEESNGDNA